MWPQEHATVFYLVEPRAALRALLRDRVEPELAELLTEPVVLSNKEDRCRLSGWQENDYTLMVKLLHLAQVREYTPLAHSKDFERVFGSRNLSAGLFDAHWTIRRLECNDDAEELRPIFEAVPALC